MMEIRKTRERSDDLISDVLSRKFDAKMLLFYSKKVLSRRRHFDIYRRCDVQYCRLCTTTTALHGFDDDLH